MEIEVGNYVRTYDGHSGIVVKYFKPTGRSMTVHIKEPDGRIWFCPDSDIIEIKNAFKSEEIKSILTKEQ